MDATPHLSRATVAWTVDRDPSTLAPSSADQHAQAQHRHSEYVDEFPAFLRLVQDVPRPTAFNLADDELHHVPPGNKDSGWQNCLNSFEKYDKELCQAYREQIDTLLVFAGLFSAVVTAFAVESYQWLQDDPLDASVELLRDVVGLLSHNLNSTATPTLPVAQGLSAAAIVRINSFWFLSLMLSLSAALVGILCKQWLREFERNVGQSPEVALAVRHVRFNGLEYWKVGSIVTSVPIIMQLALAFFVVGIVELLWRLHVVVACCVTVVAGFTLAFYLATTLLPVMQYAYICIRCYIEPFRTRDYRFAQAYTEPQCAFKSAQAWLALRVAQPLITHILRSSGVQLSTHHPQFFMDHLRRADSWVTFDLNWVKCREKVHVGPRCAFESLSWISGNLGEIHMNSWIWQCVWARCLRDRYVPDDLAVATTDIESVARSYPKMVALAKNQTPLARSQASLFQCFVRSDLPIDTAIELLLRVTAAAGPSSRWTAAGLHAICVVYRDQAIRLSDDIATGLFRLAEKQTRDIILKTGNTTAVYNGALAFKNIAAILHRGTHLRDIFLSAMRGFVLQWLRSRPPAPIIDLAKEFFRDLIWYLGLQGYHGSSVQDLRQYRGIMFIAKLAGAAAQLWPEYVHGLFEHNPLERAVLLELLAIFSDGFPELSQDASESDMDPPPAPDVGADGERSHAPSPDGLVDAHAGEETHVEAPGGTSHAAVTSLLLPQDHVRLDVHVTEEPDAEKTEVDENCPASPLANPVAPTSPPHIPVSPGLSVPPSASECDP